MNAADVRHILDTIGAMFPDARCELNHSNAFELTIAVLLSAQCTDATVNKVTADLFRKYKTPEDYLSVPLEELEQDIRKIGLFRSKAKHIQNLCRILLERYGEKCRANTRSWYSCPGSEGKRPMWSFPMRLASRRLRLTLMWNVSANGLGWQGGTIPSWRSKKAYEAGAEGRVDVNASSADFFGRYHCKAQNPKCEVCPLLDVCREGKKRMKNREAGKIKKMRTPADKDNSRG